MFSLAPNSGKSGLAPGPSANSFSGAGSSVNRRLRFRTNHRRVILSGLALWFLFLGASARAQTNSIEAADSRALEILLDRFVHSVLPAAASDVAGVHEIAAKYERTLKADGRWPDLNYQDEDRANWVGGQHLTRVLVMAKSARLRREAGRPDRRLLASTLTALQAWTGPDPQNPNWWWNRIGVPELVAEIAGLMRPELPPGELVKDIKILKRSDLTGATGANLTWCAINQVILGCLENSPTATRAAYDRLYEEVRFADAASHEEGIQPDFSFHQHGPQLYNGGYGLSYANDVGRFIYVSWGTPFQIPDAQRKLFDRFMLDGMRWMTRGDMLDYSTVGRTIVRPGLTASPRDWSLGPISPAGPAYSLGHVARLLSTLPGPRQREYAVWADCLSGQTCAQPLTGNKQFWCSDYMVHRRKAFMTSVKMFSTRIQNAEVVNAEGRRSEHLSDGANFLYLSGHEYADIFPCWDWQKIPGTTAEQVADLRTIEPHAIGTRGKTSFVGGVSDGQYGLCAMDLRRGALRAKKAWFFFDDAYVCLGAGITIGNDHPVVTTVNQSLLAGPIYTDVLPSPLREGDHLSKPLRWVYHDRVGYLFAKNQHVNVSGEVRSGRWSEIGAGSDQIVKRRVFTLWLDHGAGCTNASYDYLVLPAATLKQTRQRARDPGLDVLANSKKLQAVFCPSVKLAAVAFWNAGIIQTPIGEIAVDHPCLLLARHESERRLRVTVSNPRNEPLVVRVRVGSYRADVRLPAGKAAGSSVSQELGR